MGKFEKTLAVVGTTGLLLTGLAIAQDNVTGTGQSPGPEYTLRVTGAEAQVIFEAIQERPFKSVAGLVGKIQTQIGEQVKASQAQGQAQAPVPAPEVK